MSFIRSLQSLALMLSMLLSFGDSNSCFQSGYQLKTSWQSSSLVYLDGKKYCGIGNDGGQVFLHTAVGNASTDQGFHWIALELANPMVIDTVVMTIGGHYATINALQRRAKSIEVWTSVKEIDFGQENCSSRNISSVFNSNRDSWRWCGRTSQRSSSNVYAIMHAQCTFIHEVRMILLRKYVANISATDEQSLSFTNMSFIQANVTAEIQPSGQVIQNSSVTLRCNVVCADNITEFNSRVRLCHSNSSSKCLASGNQAYHIASAQPSHSGTYSCMVGDEVLSVVKLIVLYPPSHLNISLVNNSCKARSPSQLITIAFESSASDPTPHHQCTAFNDSHTVLLEHNQTQQYESSNSRLSFWTCQNCIVTGNLTVKCTAVQKCDSSNSSTAQSACSISTHGVLWRSSVDELLKFNCSSETHVDKEHGFNVIQIAVPTIAIFVVVLAAAIVIAKQASQSHQTTADHSIPVACYPAIELSPHQKSPSDAAPTQENISNSSNVTTAQNPESCIYATVMQGDRALRPRMTRAESVCTLYLDIVADGEEEI